MKVARQKQNCVGVESFEQIYQDYQQHVACYIGRMLNYRQNEQVEDLTQETFIRAYLALQEGTTLPPGVLGRWLLRIAHNLTIDVMRRQIVRFPLIATCDLQSDQTDELQWVVANREESFELRLACRQAIEETLNCMPRILATCLWYYVYDGYSCAEIAERLSTNVATVRVRLMRARTRFKYLYQQK